MTYRESERERAIRIRESFFGDPGMGIYKGELRAFVLSDPTKNLWERIRIEAMKYFRDHQIVWWGGNSEPSGHLLSSQVSCLNHLFFLRKDQDAALQILQGIDENFVAVCRDFDEGYIGFEVVSNGSYLGEVPESQKQTRGSNCTSVDAMMTGLFSNGKKIQVLIEWKYTEYYQKVCLADGKSGITRHSRYDHLIMDPYSPINCIYPIENLYYEPFYQIMRQTLLAWKMTAKKSRELNADDWMHFDVIPENNLHLRYQVLAPELPKTSVENAWKSVLKEPQKYNVITPQRLLRPLLFDAKHRDMINYLNFRYW